MSGHLPNIRQLYLADKGYTLFDIDLSGADAQVVAWEAEDVDLMREFRNGTKIHIYNFETMFKRKFTPEDKIKKPPGWNYSPYDSMKRFTHGTNYGASPRTIAVTLGWKIREAQNNQNQWFDLHPGIKQWHKRVEQDLRTKRKVGNRFGYRIHYFDRPDSLLPKALAWIPQSTVGILTSKAGIRLHKECPWLEILIQVHDSLVFQIPNHKVNASTMELIRDLVHIPIPYPDPLVIPWGIAMGTDSWDSCENVTWELN